MVKHLHGTVCRKAATLSLDNESVATFKQPDRRSAVRIMLNLAQISKQVRGYWV